MLVDSVKILWCYYLLKIIENVNNRKSNKGGKRHKYN